MRERIYCVKIDPVEEGMSRLTELISSSRDIGGGEGARITKVGEWGSRVGDGDWKVVYAISWTVRSRLRFRMKNMMRPSIPMPTTLPTTPPTMEGRELCALAGVEAEGEFGSTLVMSGGVSATVTVTVAVSVAVIEGAATDSGATAEAWISSRACSGSNTSVSVTFR
jgi:hypothetical protein